MAGAIFVRVSAEPAATQARTFEIWIVATDDPAEAEKAVRERVPTGRNVEAHRMPLYPWSYRGLRTRRTSILRRSRGRSARR